MQTKCKQYIRLFKHMGLYSIALNLAIFSFILYFLTFIADIIIENHRSELNGLSKNIVRIPKTNLNVLHFPSDDYCEKNGYLIILLKNGLGTQMYAWFSYY